MVCPEFIFIYRFTLERKEHEWKFALANHKNLNIYRGFPRLRASPRHGGASRTF
jgi:hypothetical protein